MFPRPLRQNLAAAALEVTRPGESDLDGPTLASVGRLMITLVILFTNLVGAVAVLILAAFVLPLPAVRAGHHVRLANTVAALIFVAVAFPLGVAAGTRGMRRVRRWLQEDREASLREARIVLEAPLRLFQLQISLWFIAAVIFGLLDGRYSGALGLRVGIIVALTGLVTGACSYLIVELLLRPAAVRAFARGVSSRLSVPGVATRAVLAWLIGTGVPLVGLVTFGISALAGSSDTTVHSLGITMVVLGGAGLAVGLLAITVAARATADPVESVARALEQVSDGDFDVRVPVYDGTQIGQLQLGFNAMVQGLAERERIRETFGTYVDPEVAERILEEGTDLAGEEVEVTVMFIDVRDFTGFAEQTPADEVVTCINELFEQIIPIIHEHNGRVDKFVGDGLLAVFGAPRRLEDHADQAMGAAMDIIDKVHSGRGLRMGIGLNTGKVVAGNIGGAGRLEFSVMGDAVNVAARVEAATRETEDEVLLTERTRELLSDPPELCERGSLELRGRQEEIRVYAPQAATEPPPARETDR